MTSSNSKSRAGIVWVASFQKSGNTWTRAFLHNLASVMSGLDKELDINGMGRFTTAECSKPFYIDALGYEPTDADKAAVAALRPTIQRQIADAHSDIVFVKTHLALARDRGHTTINFEVTSGAIYLVRNPLDVAISYAAHMGYSVDEAISVMGRSRAESNICDRNVHEVFGSWSENVLSWTRTPHPAIYIMRYEDMLDRPFEVFGGLARHLRLNADEAQIAEAIERSSFERLRKQEAQKGFAERYVPDRTFFREGRAGQWRTGLTAAQVDRIVADHGEQMQRFGYLP